MQITNTLFRSGGAALLLSNRTQDQNRSRYVLEHTVRTHIGSDDQAYGCVFQCEDAEGIVGVKLDRSIMRVASKALTLNITRLGPKILPLSEKVKYVVHMLRKKSTRRHSDTMKATTTTIRVTAPTDANGTKQDQEYEEPVKPAGEPEPMGQSTSQPTSRPVDQPPKSVSDDGSARRHRRSRNQEPPYVPNFKKAVDHFCIHAGGRGVIDSIQKSLSLSDYDVAPSRAVLKRRGNTSSSSIWYELRELEDQGRVKRGHKIWQMAFGSGFKCNSAIWRALT